MILCARCGEEVRWGWRHGRQDYWHREDVDHNPLLGQLVDWDSVNAGLDKVRTFDDGTVYTAREYDEAKYAKKRRGSDGPEPEPLPPVETPCTPAPTSGTTFTLEGRQIAIPGGCRTLLNKAAKLGWDVKRFTYSRGPFVGGNGKVLSVSDCFVLGMRRGDSAIVAMWRDGKYVFGHIIEPGSWRKVNATELKGFME